MCMRCVIGKIADLLLCDVSFASRLNVLACVWNVKLFRAVRLCRKSCLQSSDFKHLLIEEISKYNLAMKQYASNNNAFSKDAVKSRLLL